MRQGNFKSHLQFFFWQCLSLAWNSLSRLEWVSRKPQGSVCLCSHHWDNNKNLTCHAWPAACGCVSCDRHILLAHLFLTAEGPGKEEPLSFTLSSASHTSAFILVPSFLLFFKFWESQWKLYLPNWLLSLNFFFISETKFHHVVLTDLELVM